MNEPKKRFIIELSARETLIYRAQIIVEVPANCLEDLKELDGDMLTDIARENGILFDWTYEDYVDFEIQESIDVVEETEKSPDVQLTFDKFNRFRCEWMPKVDDGGGHYDQQCEEAYQD